MLLEKESVGGDGPRPPAGEQATCGIVIREVCSGAPSEGGVELAAYGLGPVDCRICLWHDLFLPSFRLCCTPLFFSLFSRSFLPFEASEISKQTVLTVIRPEGGNAVVPIGRSVTIAVEATGRLPDPKGPDALRLLYRYQQN